MKNLIKIIIICGLFIIAVGAVLIYAETQMSPPDDLKYSNQFNEKLTEDLNNFPAKDNVQHYYLISLDKINLYNKEGWINDESFDNHLIKLASKYAPIIYEQGLEEISKNSWNENYLKIILNEINTLRAQKTKIGNKNVMAGLSDINNGITLIVNTVNSYYQAKNLANSITFHGIKDAENKIRKAKNYMSDTYLKNNASLMATLKSLPAKLGRSHYQYLVGKLNQLDNFSNYSLQTYIQKRNNFISEVDEYQNRASKTYGISHEEVSSNVARINNKLETQYNSATQYYAPSR